ncbi:uncharacterized protein N7483_000888 [Penicillium malachiteum]|uniref:uncharacterized protein n=1 Tax=Penicillium malachiteum TaxID=1324776 RepID=UPI002548F722|nr:uncharacterized protein N7483_000888 [Penicillium malachiteum]KAJ5735763.1 hypothetical protein N7483_000888 [Penicillium malachiteum]
MTTMQHMPPKAYSSDDVHHRPKGILKNSRSFQNEPVVESLSTPPSVPTIAELADTKELTLQNTLQNAGPRRRSSSNTQPGAQDRRQSSASAQDENSPRLKWDEANLYLAEQDRTAKMKIDEPKTPYAPHYDPTEDDEEMRLEEAKESLIDAQDIVVDELDRAKGHHQKGVSEDDIPDLELGEAEEAQPTGESPTEDPRIFRQRSLSTESQKQEKHVHVGSEANGDDGVPGDDGLMSTEEAKEKHRLFERQRKRHYEMNNIKDLLAHPENLDEMEEDEDEPAPQAVPQMPQRFRNGGQ